MCGEPLPKLILNFPLSQAICNVLRECLEGLWRMSEKSVESVWRMSEECLESVWSVCVESFYSHFLGLFGVAFKHVGRREKSGVCMDYEESGLNIRNPCVVEVCRSINDFRR